MNQICIVVAMAAALCSASSAVGKQLWAKSYLGKQAPSFVVEKWLSQAPDTEGKFVLIDFWATWCGPCRKAIPELNAIHRELGKKVVVIGVSDESEANVRAMSEPKIEYAVAIDPEKRMFSKLEIEGIPHVILIDPQGIVRWEGYPLLKGDELTLNVVEGIVTKYSGKQGPDQPAVAAKSSQGI